MSGSPYAGRPAIQALVDAVIAVWPEHQAYLDKSFAARTEALLDTSDRMAAAVLELAADNVAGAAADYRWLCDRIREEELNFARTDAYRFSTFAETNAHVYADDAFMQRYMNGLLFSHVLWFMHASSLHFFTQRLAARVQRGGKVLEVGSGHGLLLFIALRDLGLDEAVAWDLSPVSLDHTRAALARLGAVGKARFAVQDMHEARSTGERFDLVILSHLLEHLEEPGRALETVGALLAPGGVLFVNIPLNAPMPDHIQLLRAPEEVEAMLRAGGFRVLEFAAHTTQAMPLGKALKRKAAVTCSVIAERA
ncbi:MAG: class I SAM-dependent methyltransferase [Sphingomonas sp.]|uniref:class I SAM-dependent methyltransferase n=1 Tax=Sphingomonas sp. TaxID=28214 RepID=UPI0025E2D17D|nr:class I SAM-dependent methyltransferase [Sphingomonas sp.]MBX9881851.1 class I SAM-dependent methyltransferase [Sphingomonas sp.]